MSKLEKAEKNLRKLANHVAKVERRTKKAHKFLDRMSKK